MYTEYDKGFILRHGTMVEMLSNSDDNFVDAIVTDPPYGLKFMGKEWDHGVPSEVMWVEALRVLKPGGYLLAFGGTRTFHRLAVAIEDAGFEIRDCLSWLYGQGFPKSHNVAKAIDKASRGVPHGGADPTSPNHGRYKTQATEGKRGGSDKGQGYGGGPGSFMAEQGERVQSEYEDPDAQRWEGWGTALKPAWEPIIMARKPFKGTVAANVLEHGTGAINIDGTRIATSDSLGGGAESQTRGDQKGNEGWTRPWMEDEEAREAHAERVRQNVARAEELGRWPANVVLDETAAAMLDRQSGELKSGHRKSGEYTTRAEDSGGASRFFYNAKASKSERNAGLPEGVTNKHPTVKPVDVMRWLVRMVTPPGGLVMDPFMGSGTTGIAALDEGFAFIGIDSEREYVDLAYHRLIASRGEEE